jgi:hypothetical protein
MAERIIDAAVIAAIAQAVQPATAAAMLFMNVHLRNFVDRTVWFDIRELALH